MPDFEPRMDKWGGSIIGDLATDAKDAITNKGRVERTRKRAEKRAARRARWKRSWLGRFVAWLWVWVRRAIVFVILMWVIIQLWNIFEVGQAVFG